MMRLLCALTLGAAATLGTISARASDYAVAVQYVSGTGVGSDWITGDPFADPTTALGRPTVDTTGDVFAIPLEETVPIVPVYGSSRHFEMVSVGHNGSIVLEFDHPVRNDPRNPYGIDFIVFGNAFCAVDLQNPWRNGDPNLTFFQTGSGFIDPATVSVSADGTVWHTFSDQIGPHADPEGPYADTDGPFADVFAPTLGRVYDPENPEPSIGVWNQWWGQPTDPTRPLDPRLTWLDLQGWSVAEMAILYGNSAGGTGFDLDWLEVPAPDAIRYVRVQVGSDEDIPEIDAVSDVFACLGDPDGDGDVDLLDYAQFQKCYTGEGLNAESRDCFCLDFDRNLVNDDRDVDRFDLAAFVAVLNGPGGA